MTGGASGRVKRVWLTGVLDCFAFLCLNARNDGRCNDGGMASVRGYRALDWIALLMLAMT